MSVNDPISDMLTRIRNAGMARQLETTMPSTNDPGGDCEDSGTRGLHRRI
jgi:hypothetical protein